MTILNLNGPASREPRSKKTVRAWMGVGLVIAVLGIGSTFAANINLGNNDESEFGQGVTKTVYCGDNTAYPITITPISAFKIGETISGRAAVPSRWTAPTYTGRTFVRVSSSSSTAVGEGTYVNDLSGATETKVKGYWISSRTSSNPTYSSNGNSSGSNTVFVPQVRDNNDYGFYKYSSWNPGSMSIAVASTPSIKVADSFLLKGITVSNIDPACDDRNFVISAYDDTESLPFVTGGYKEIAILYTANVSSGGGLKFSFDRTAKNVPDNKETLATVIKGDKKFSVNFKPNTDRINADDLTNIVIETQDNQLGPQGDTDDEDDDEEES